MSTQWFLEYDNGTKRGSIITAEAIALVKQDTHE